MAHVGTSGGWTGPVPAGRSAAPGRPVRTDGRVTAGGPGTAGGLVTAARVLAEVLLAELPERWRHSIGVVHRADQLSVTVDPADRETLLAAAWLHDIGYGRVARRTGFHPLDGAEYLIRHGWSPRIAALVAHHSAAHLLASGQETLAREHGGADRGRVGYGHPHSTRGPSLVGALAAYPDEHSPVSDALTYADQSTGPVGQPLPIRVRMAEMLARHGAGSAQARVHHLRGPYLLAIAERVEARLASTGYIDAGQMAAGPANAGWLAQI